MFSWLLGYVAYKTIKVKIDVDYNGETHTFVVDFHVDVVGVPIEIKASLPIGILDESSNRKVFLDYNHIQDMVKRMVGCNKVLLKDNSDKGIVALETVKEVSENGYKKDIVNHTIKVLEVFEK